MLPRAWSQPCCPYPHCPGRPLCHQGLFKASICCSPMSISGSDSPQDSDPAANHQEIHTCSTLSSGLVTTLLSTQVPRPDTFMPLKSAALPPPLLPPSHHLLLILPPAWPSVFLLPPGPWLPPWPRPFLCLPLWPCTPNPIHQHSGRQSKPSELDHGTPMSKNHFLWPLG